jgi:hypothetical protein
MVSGRLVAQAHGRGRCCAKEGCNTDYWPPTFSSNPSLANHCAPGTEYYLIVTAGLVVSLTIIAATLPLIERTTGPETARNE